MKQVIQVKQNHTMFAVLAFVLCTFIILIFVLLLSKVEAQMNSFLPAQAFTYETIVDETGAYSGELPSDIPGTIVGMTVFRLEPSNNTWYPVSYNSVYDDDEIAINISFKADGRAFGGYLQHNYNNGTWEPIDEYIGDRLRIVLFVR